MSGKELRSLTGQYEAIDVYYIFLNVLSSVRLIYNKRKKEVSKQVGELSPLDAK